MRGWPSGLIAGASTFLFLFSTILMTQVHRVIAALGARGAGQRFAVDRPCRAGEGACHRPLAVGMLLFGASVGNMITLPPLVVERNVPPEAYAAIVALNGAVVRFCFAFGPALLGTVRDLSGGYEAVLALCAALQLAGTAVMWRGR